MKGILLAGGSGTRLYPVTRVINKHLLPIYDKPMIYYPMTTLMFMGIKDILIISSPQHIEQFSALFGSGEKLGLHIEYAVQEAPRGIAEALIIGEHFAAGDSVALILGDNIFYGHDLPRILKSAAEENERDTVIGYYVKDPERYVIAKFDDNFNVISIEEKPKKPKSNIAVVGLYIYDSRAAEFAKKVEPSDRGELEITSVNQMYLDEGKLKIKVLGRGFAWFDAGTHEAFIESATFVRAIEERQAFKIGCVEEVAYRMGFIDLEQLEKLAEELKKSSYGEYLLRMVKEEKGLKRF